MNIVESEIIEILRNLSFATRTQIRMVTDGLLDSIALVDLALALESHFGISVSALELTSENFDSIPQIAAFVLKKQVAK